MSDYYVYRCDVVATVPSSLSSTKLLLSISISPSSFPLDELAKGFQGGIFASSIALGNASQFLSAIDARSMRSQSSRKDLTRTLYKDLQVEDPMYASSCSLCCLFLVKFNSEQVTHISAGLLFLGLRASVLGSIYPFRSATFMPLAVLLFKIFGSPLWLKV